MIEKYDEKDVSFSGLIRIKKETEYGIKILIEIIDIKFDINQSNIQFKL